MGSLRGAIRRPSNFWLVEARRGLRGGDAPLLHPVAKGATGEAEKAGDLGDVAAGVPQRLLDQVLLDRLEGAVPVLEVETQLLRIGGGGGAPRAGAVEAGGLELVAGGDQDDSLEGVREFANVAWPVVAGELVEHLLAGTNPRLAILPTELLEEVLDEEGDIAGTLAECGQFDVHDLESIVEVGSELVALNRLFELAVRRGDDPDVDRALLCTADPARTLRLENVQELRLHLEGHVPDLIEEDRAATRDFEEPLFPLGRAGERALLVSEKFTFDQVAGESRAVHLHEGVIRQWAAIVNEARQEVLTGPRLALDQHGRQVGGGFEGDARELIDEGADFVELGAPADDLRLFSLAAALPLESLHLGAQARVLQFSRDDELQLLQVEGLFEVVDRPFLHRLDGTVDRRVGGDDQHRHLGEIAAQAAQDLEAAHIGELNVKDREVGRILLEDGIRLPPRLREETVVPLPPEFERQRLEEGLFVIEDQDLSHPAIFLVFRPHF